MASFGEKVRRRRKEKGWTLEQLAQAIGTTKSYAWEIENKPSIRPTAEKVFALAKALDVSAEYLSDASRTDPKSIRKQQVDASDRDVAFFRRFSALSDEEKETVRKMMELLDERNRKRP